MECWNIGILKYWLAKGCHWFLNFIDKVHFLIKPLSHYPKPIIPSFHHSTFPFGMYFLRIGSPLGLNSRFQHSNP